MTHCPVYVDQPQVTTSMYCAATSLSSLARTAPVHAEGRICAEMRAFNLPCTCGCSAWSHEGVFLCTHRMCPVFLFCLCFAGMTFRVVNYCVCWPCVMVCTLGILDSVTQAQHPELLPFQLLWLVIWWHFILNDLYFVNPAWPITNEPVFTFSRTCIYSLSLTVDSEYKR